MKELKWYVNRKFVGKGSSQETLFFNAGAGHHDVMVVDDLGRVTTREIDVQVVR